MAFQVVCQRNTLTQKLRVLLLCQIWIVNYYVKCSSDNLSNENKNTDISKIVHFGISIHVLSWNIYFRLLRKNRNWKLTIISQNNWRYVIWRSRMTQQLVWKLIDVLKKTSVLYAWAHKYNTSAIVLVINKFDWLL